MNVSSKCLKRGCTNFAAFCCALRSFTWLELELTCPQHKVEHSSGNVFHSADAPFTLNGCALLKDLYSRAQLPSITRQLSHGSRSTLTGSWWVATAHSHPVFQRLEGFPSQLFSKGQYISLKHRDKAVGLFVESTENHTNHHKATVSPNASDPHSSRYRSPHDLIWGSASNKSWLWKSGSPPEKVTPPPDWSE